MLSYCAGTGVVMHGLVTVRTGTVQPTATTTEDGVIGHVPTKPTGSVRGCIYLNFIGGTASCQVSESDLNRIVVGMVKLRKNTKYLMLSRHPE